jgi:predicted Zn-dependent protease
VQGCVAAPGPTKTAQEPPRDRNKELGRAFLSEALRQYQFVKDPEVTSLVTQIGRKIAAAQGSDPTAYHFFVYRELQPNAFAIPGGYIFITDSLLVKLRSPEELSGVLAHEIAHVERNHFFQDEGKLQAVNLATLAAILLSRGNPAVVAGGIAANVDLQLHYSRENESEADTYAVQYLKKAGYDPQGLLRSFETLAFYEQFSAPDVPVYFSTHPGLRERMKNLELVLRQAPPSGSAPGGGTPKALGPIGTIVDWERIAVGLQAQLHSFTEIPVLVRGIMGESEDPERKRYLTGVAYLKTGHFAEAVPEYQAAIALKPDSAVYHADLAQSYFQLQDLSKARLEAKEALQHDPNQPLALMMMGRLAEHSGDFAEAITFYKNALVSSSDGLAHDPLLHLRLAQSYGRVGDEADQTYHLGRFLRLDLKPKAALREFEKAGKLAAGQDELASKIKKELEEIKRDGI